MFGLRARGAWAASLLWVFSAACSSAPDAPPTDAGPNDAGPITDGGPRDGGARPDAGPDAGWDPGPDDSLDGTSLEGVTLVWAQPLELCKRWRENETIESELETKVRVVLPAHARATPGRRHLESSTLSQGLVQRGPLAADALRIEDMEVTSSVTDFRIVDPTGDSSLGATVEHDLGAAGTLYETFSIFRRRGTPDPIVYGDDYEMTFAYRPPGSEAVTTLGPCDGDPGLEPWVNALVARNGDEWITITRFQQSNETFAGSFPVWPTAAVLKSSTDIWSHAAAFGFWSQTYAAQHHNWFETSVIDFTRDLSWYGRVYGPFQAGTPPLGIGSMVTKLSLDGIDGWEVTPTVDVESLDLATGQLSTRTFTVEEGWRPIDTSRAQLSLRSTCPNGEVTTLGDGEWAYAFLVERCTPGNGFVADSIIPVAFAHAPTHIGRRFERGVLTPVEIEGWRGYSLRIGDTSVVITHMGGDYIVEVVRNGEPLVSRISDKTPIASISPYDETLTFTGPNQISAKLERRWAAQGVGESAIFAPISFELTFDGETHRVEAWDRFDYTNTHHNWADAIEAQDGDLLLRWRTEFIPERKDFVSAVRDSGETVLAETQVQAQ